MRIVFFLVAFIFFQVFLLIRNAFIFIVHSLIIYIASQIITSEKILIQRDKLIYNIISIVFVEALINVFIKNIYWTLFVSYILFFVLSIGFYFLHQFRGNNLNFADIFCIATAKEVAGGYKYDINPRFIYSLGLTIVSLAFFKSSVNMGNNLVMLCRIVFVLVLYIVLRIICSQNKFNYSLNAGEDEGYIYNFISSCPIFYISLKKEEVYNVNLDGTINSCEDAGVNIIHQTVGASENTVGVSENAVGAKFTSPPDAPHVIVIMNESFSHINERINTNIPVTPVYDGLKGVLKGNLLVNTFGGGTETTEFEFLTGMHIGSNAYPIYPYNQIKIDKYTLARFFDNIGYRTMAMHPYTATNYHRNAIYKLFGFKEMFFYDEFKHKETVRNYVSDDAMYDEVIDRFEETKNKEQKTFLFGITMQNHSGYDSFDGQEIEVTDYAEEKNSINSYLSLLHISDKSIQKLIDYFDKENEHVIICFFGDHNASFSPSMNKRYYDISKNYEGKNVYETPFFIYDNKNKKDENIKQISANFLSLELIKRAGLELTDYYKLLDSIYERVYYMNFHKEKLRNDNLMYYIDNIEKEYTKYKSGFLK